MIRRVAGTGMLILVALVSTTACNYATGRDETKAREVTKTDEEWAKQLTRTQFLVTRKKATEPAFSGKLVNNHARGTYHCICCDAPLFGSNAKFESGTGWPSFFKPIDAPKIDTVADHSGGDERVEVMCNTCGAHLGHVFNDGPAPTGLRYCINSASLKFVKPEAKPKAKDEKPSKSEKAEPPAKP